MTKKRERMNESDFTLGSLLRHLRRRHPRNLNLRDIAELWEVSVSYVSAVENDEKVPTEERLVQLLKYLGEEAERKKVMQLAASGRKTVQIEIRGRSPMFKDFMATLARRSADLSDDQVAEMNRVIKGIIHDE